MYDVHIEVESLVYIYVYVGSRTIFFPVIHVSIKVFTKIKAFTKCNAPFTLIKKFLHIKYFFMMPQYTGIIALFMAFIKFICCRKPKDWIKSQAFKMSSTR